MKACAGSGSVVEAVLLLCVATHCVMLQREDWRRLLQKGKQLWVLLQECVEHQLTAAAAV